MLAQAASSIWHPCHLSPQSAADSHDARFHKLHRRTTLAARAASQPSSNLSLQTSQHLPLADQPGFSRSEPETVTLLTKARKATKPSFSAKQPSKLAKIGTAAGYAAMAVGAGAVINALAADASQVAVASAALAAGAVVLPAVATRANRGAHRSEQGRDALLLAAISMGVAQNLSRAINLGNTLRPRAISQRSASTDQQSSDRSTSADSNVVQPLEIEVVTDPSELEQQTEEDMMSQILGQYSDAEWRRLAQIIEDQPCQVPLDDALLFAQHFNPTHQLQGETVDPLPSRVVHQPKMSPGRQANQAKRKEKLKQKEKKKRRKRRE